MKRVMIFGTFDLLHPGHLFVLEEAGKRGEVTVIVARSENVLKIKGAAPRQSGEERVAAIREKFPAYHVVLGDADDFLTPIRQFAPDLILLGYDQKLPPGVTDADFGEAGIERLEAFKPDIYKSSLQRKNMI